MPLSINQALSQFVRRAERGSQERLVSTFVGIGNLVAALTSQDHRIIFGRRGTGKTHALSYVKDVVSRGGNHAILVDLRTVGSDQSIYSDPSRSFAERASVLLVDLLTHLHNELLAIATDPSHPFDLSQLAPPLDAFADAVSRVRVVGPVQQETRDAEENRESQEATAAIGIKGLALTADLGSSDAVARTASRSTTRTVSGLQRHHLVFGDIQSSPQTVLRLFNGRRIWVLLDEWSSIPSDLQPYLADLIRRCLYPIPQLTVQIAAIEQRCNFMMRGAAGSYIGIELGADATADIDLDDFMVFENDAERAKEFFRQFLYNHFVAVEDRNPNIVVTGASDLARQIFTEIRAFEEFVQAVEGVPRDAINIIGLAAFKAGEQRISVQSVRAAARDWYQRDKASAISSRPDAGDLLRWVITEVIQQRRARAFLLRSDQRSQIIDDLFDARLLHLLKKSVAAHDNPGVRYLVYKLDYGCYVDLLLTARAPQGLLPAEHEMEFIEVPPDDYRAIRRAILDLDAFAQRASAS